MPRSYVHLSLEDCRKIARWHDAKMPALEIAARLSRHRATIHRELKRNRFIDAELQHLSGYYALNAQSKSEARRAGLRKLIRHRDLCHVVVRLKTGWTPEQIAGPRRLDGSDLRVSHETIYQFAYSKDGHAIDLWRHLPEHRRRRRGRGKRRSQAHKFSDELSIRHRPEAVSAREEFGSWEGDLIQFRKEFGPANVTSLVSRRSLQRNRHVQDELNKISLPDRRCGGEYCSRHALCQETFLMPSGYQEEAFFVSI